MLSSDASLSTLIVSDGTLSPVFTTSVTNYTVEVAYTVEEINIWAMKKNAGATVTGDTGEQALMVGANPFTITVTAEDGTTKVYTVTVTRAESPVGIEQVSAEGVQIYPNPVTDHFRVKGITRPTVVSVYTLQGKLQLQRKVQADEYISAGSLPSGIYLIRVEGTTFKVVKK